MLRSVVDEKRKNLQRKDKVWYDKKATEVEHVSK